MYIVELDTTMEVDQSSGDNGYASDANATSKKGDAPLHSIHCILYSMPNNGILLYINL